MPSQRDCADGIMCGGDAVRTRMAEAQRCAVTWQSSFAELQNKDTRQKSANLELQLDLTRLKERIAHQHKDLQVRSTATAVQPTHSRVHIFAHHTHPQTWREKQATLRQVTECSTSACTVCIVIV